MAPGLVERAATSVANDQPVQSSREEKKRGHLGRRSGGGGVGMGVWEKPPRGQASKSRVSPSSPKHSGFLGTETSTPAKSRFPSVLPGGGHGQDLATWILFKCPGQL